MLQPKVGEPCMMIKRLVGDGHPLKALSTSISWTLNHFANEHLRVTYIQLHIDNTTAVSYNY